MISVSRGASERVAYLPDGVGGRARRRPCRTRRPEAWTSPAGPGRGGWPAPCRSAAAARPSDGGSDRRSRHRRPGRGPDGWPLTPLRSFRPVPAGGRDRCRRGGGQLCSTRAGTAARPLGACGGERGEGDRATRRRAEDRTTRGSREVRSGRWLRQIVISQPGGAASRPIVEQRLEAAVPAGGDRRPSHCAPSTARPVVDARAEQLRQLGGQPARRPGPGWSGGVAMRPTTTTRSHPSVPAQFQVTQILALSSLLGRGRRTTVSQREVTPRRGGSAGS